ncbi:hypothetical protein IMY05_005G0194400 [Salix suchowensis]|nr:hypothetical protein IMY05_005G0194400 [Salix suchowensis]
MISLPFFSFFFHFLVAVVSNTHSGENSSYSLSTTKQPAIKLLFSYYSKPTYLSEYGKCAGSLLHGGNGTLHLHNAL